MALTNAEKQRRHRERAKAKAAAIATEAEIAKATAAEAQARLAALEAKPAPSSAAVDLSSLRSAVDELYDARAKPSEWRIRMRDEIGKLGG